MKVKEFMSPEPWTISKERSISEAKDTMLIHRVRRLPVMDGDTLVGMVTKEDILAASPSIVDFMTPEEIRERLEGTTVESIMAQDPYTVKADDPIEKAALVMRNKKIGGLPVLDNGKLVGVITETDIFRTFVDIMGIDSDTKRFDLPCPDTDKALDAAREKLDSEGLRVVSLLIHEKISGDRKLIVRGRKK